MNAITPRNDTEALLLEKFQALLADLYTAGDTEVRKTRTKTLTTSNNHITISRRHRRCNSCRNYAARTR